MQAITRINNPVFRAAERVGAVMLVRRPLPSWLQRPRSAYLYSRNAVRGYDYWTAIYWATPPWISKEHRREMREIYRNRPAGHHVDHIVPLKGATVCGLNVPWNLQYLPAGTNMSKGARYWPGCSHENMDLFPPKAEPHQLKIAI